MLLAGLTSGILTSGGDVYAVSTTPSVSYQKKGFDFGMISASHNPDNGIKVFASDGTKNW